MLTTKRAPDLGQSAAAGEMDRGFGIGHQAQPAYERAARECGSQ